MASAKSSSVYITDHSESVIRTHSWRTVSNSVAYLIPHLRADVSILDVGCGPGSITIDLARYVPQGHVIGLEYVSDPLEAARSSAAASSITNVSFEVGDIHKLPYKDDTFDIVHAHQVLQHVADPILALKEMRRVTKSGGLVACREAASFAWYPESEKLDAGLRLQRKVAIAKGGNPQPGSRIHVWAEQAGFKQKEITKSTGSWCYSSDEEREYWGGSKAERVRSSGFANLALKEGFATKDELDSIAEGWEEFQKDQRAWFGIMHGEIVCRKSKQ